MLSNAQRKLIRSLEHKKYRTLHGLFVVEGPKAVREFMKYQEPEILLTDVEDIRQVSFLQHPQDMLAVFKIPSFEQSEGDKEVFEGKLVIALDGVQDPGNLGTIIRIADWFGIKTIVCSKDTADAYNPKTVQATMGSLARIDIIYVDSLSEWLETLPAGMPIYGTLLDGDNIYQQKLSKEGVIVMGNEGKGISDEVRKLVTHKLLIPSFSNGDTAESLNVAIATAITCSEFRRGD
ncbi:MAG: RNA methyltransferase [Bacteroidaceae bacterium]|nr:RNA methyltransferase [Bacteroidaceae bacterium]